MMPAEAARCQQQVLTHVRCPHKAHRRSFTEQGPSAKKELARHTRLRARARHASAAFIAVSSAVSPMRTSRSMSLHVPGLVSSRQLRQSLPSTTGLPVRLPTPRNGESHRCTLQTCSG
jgi:hypothetical protein